MESSKANATSFKPGNQAAKGHGAPRGNHNAFKHGRRSERKLVIGDLPEHCERIGGFVQKLRIELETLVASVHGSIGSTADMFIQSACRHEQAALLAQRWLRLDAANMNHGERLAYLQAIASESDKRDKCVERLKLDRDPSTILEALYAAPTVDVEAMEGGDDGAG